MSWRQAVVKHPAVFVFSTQRKDEKHTSLVLTDIVVRTNRPNQLSKRLLSTYIYKYCHSARVILCLQITKFHPKKAK